MRTRRTIPLFLIAFLIALGATLPSVAAPMPTELEAGGGPEPRTLAAAPAPEARRLGLARPSLARRAVALFRRLRTLEPRATALDPSAAESGFRLRRGLLLAASLSADGPDEPS